MSLQGTLRTLGITEVLEFLADRNASGRLEIEAESGMATYWMLDGGIASVEYEFDREAGTDAAEATYYALAELEGTFMFSEDGAPEEGTDTESVPDILGRTADTAEAWSTVEELIPTPEHWLTRTESFSEPITVEPQWWEAIDAIGAGCTSRQLTQSLGMRALSSSLMATDMARAGLLQVTEAPTTEHPAGEHPVDVEIDDEQTDSAVAPVVEFSPEQDEYELSAPAAEPESAPLHQDGVDDQPVVDDEHDPAPTYEVQNYEEVPEFDTATAVQELEAAVGELAAMSEESLDFEPVEYGEHDFSATYADDTAASQEWPVDEDLVAESPAIDWNAEHSADQPAEASFDAAPAEDDGWATDHGRPSPVFPAVQSMSEPAEPTHAEDSATKPGSPEHDGELQSWGAAAGAPAMPTIPEPEPPFSSGDSGSALEGLFGSTATEAEESGSELAYLPAPEPPAPEAVFDRDVATPVADTDIHAEFEDADDESFGTEDRSSVLKFLRRD